MSKMADFYSKVMADKDLQTKLKGILGDKNIADATDADLEKIGDLAKEAGFAITLAEAKEYLSANETVVSDEALDAVAGGAYGKPEYDHSKCIGGGGHIDDYRRNEVQEERRRKK